MGGSCRGLGAVLEYPGEVWAGSWGVLGGSWGLLGDDWRVEGGVFRGLGRIGAL